MVKIKTLFFASIILVFVFIFLGIFVYTNHEESNRHKNTMMELNAKLEKNDFIFAAQQAILAIISNNFYGCDDSLCLAKKLYESSLKTNPVFFDDYYLLHGKNSVEIERPRGTQITNPYSVL